MVILTLTTAVIAESTHPVSKPQSQVGLEVNLSAQYITNIFAALKLTEKEQSAVRPVLQDFTLKRCDIFKSYGLGAGHKKTLDYATRRALVKELIALRKVTNEQVSKLLPEEKASAFIGIQKKHLRELRKALKEIQQPEKIKTKQPDKAVPPLSQVLHEHPDQILLLEATLIFAISSAPIPNDSRNS